MRSLGDVARTGTGGLLLRSLGNVPAHLAGDARELLGPAAALLAAAGVVAALADPALRPLAPVWALGAVLFVGLVPVFYSDRYSLVLLPVYAALAAAAVVAAGRRGRGLAWAGGLAA